MQRLTVLVAFLVGSPVASAMPQQTPVGPDLHVGAHVRVIVPAVAPTWLDGTVVVAQASPSCFAVRLEHTDAQGRQQYAFLAGVTALEVDRRTNQGVLTLGLPPATDADWQAWSHTDLQAAAARCRRGAPT